ncbi:ketosteroid isomerase-like protein [Arthrobacter sp. 1088]|uniref:nuclear transport factor 2 family protein n=1 Tax=Arthrobacter sp. 1088 TaxID=2817768 RepID=UPI0028639DAB|nr:nuclear transport factor 2 family protein [Arthrobacter sp. 1088]MDR6684612.1 ketosteroid isomerase-like protein [Arthrobacter sp. 1088]
MSTETDNFLAEMVPKQLAADGAIHDGDAGPRLALWSENEPLTLFGASLSGSGRAELEPMFQNVASWFSHSDSFDLEIIAAGVSGDLAYTVGYEHTTTTVEGTPRKYSLRVTHVYRRENGAWRIVHRHADFPAGEASVPLPAGRTGPMTGERQAMGRETEAFLAEILPKQRDMTVALHKGDVAPRISLWSHTDPITLFGAHISGAGWTDLEPKFRREAHRFDGATGFEFEVVAAGASGSLAYTVGLEHSQAIVDGAPDDYTMRTTQVYRREDDAWRIVHRHSDLIPIQRPQ